VKPPAPEILRKGALVRVAGGPDADDVSAWALAFLDLRFIDGHVERWLGPGAVAEISTRASAMNAVLAWATESADEHAQTVFGEIAMDYDVKSLPHVDGVPCEEVVLEWHATPTWELTPQRSSR